MRLSQLTRLLSASYQYHTISRPVCLKTTTYRNTPQYVATCIPQYTKLFHSRTRQGDVNYGKPFYYLMGICQDVHIFLNRQFEILGSRRPRYVITVHINSITQMLCWTSLDYIEQLQFTLFLVPTVFRGPRNLPSATEFTHFRGISRELTK
jgi:hypothetical protein